MTLGLPIIRTSVDHGVAFDIAGKGIASEDSMVAAIEMATRMAPHQVEAIGIYLFPIHQLIFGKMLRSIVEVVEKSARSFHEPA